jgi:hypothetical protein
MKTLTALIVAAAWVLRAAPAAAQDHPAMLASLFQDIFGPNGLVLSSDDVTLDGTTHAAHFNSAFQSDFHLVNIALTSQLAAVPLASPASGFTYRFNPGTGTFERSARSFGPIMTDRGETIGRGRMAFGFSYQFFSFDRLDGVPLVSMPAVFTHDSFELGGGRSDVIGTVNTIEASISQFSGALTYGLTDRVDIALAVPIVQTSLSLLSNATIYRVGTGANTDVHYFPDAGRIGGFGSSRQFFAEGTAAGVGDIVFRAKGTLLREGTRALAAGLDVRFPTGDETNLLGAGAAGFRPFAAFSTALGAFAPHLNLAYQWNGKSVLGGDVRSREKQDLPDQFVVAAGSDLAVNSRFSVIVDMVAQRVFDSPRAFTRALTATGPAGAVSLPDIRFETTSYWTSAASLGFKTNVARGVLVNFNLRFALAENGLTDRVAPLLGLEWAF